MKLAILFTGGLIISCEKKNNKPKHIHLFSAEFGEFIAEKSCLGQIIFLSRTRSGSVHISYPFEKFLPQSLDNLLKGPRVSNGQQS